MTYEKINDERKIELWNAYCEDMNNSDDKVYANDDTFLQDFYGDDVYTLAKDLDAHDYRINDEYVMFTIYGLKSYASIYNFIYDVCDDNSEFKKYAIANYNE